MTVTREGEDEPLMLMHSSYFSFSPAIILGGAPPPPTAPPAPFIFFYRECESTSRRVASWGASAI